MQTGPRTRRVAVTKFAGVKSWLCGMAVDAGSRRQRAARRGAVKPGSARQAMRARLGFGLAWRECRTLPTRLSPPLFSGRKMTPFREFPSAPQIAYVLCDLDDTLTLDGVLPAASYSGLESLKAHGRSVVVVTGRPAGWCDLIARFWPVEGVVGEN